MRRRWLTTILAALVVALGVAAWLCWPRALPEEECSAAYRQWADVEGVEATFIRGYRVNDTLTIDATLLQATDSAGWDSLESYYEFLPTLSNNDQAALADGRDLIKIFININGNKKHLSENEILVASLRDKYTCIFHMNNISERDRLFDPIMDKIFNSLKVNEKIVHQ